MRYRAFRIFYQLTFSVAITTLYFIWRLYNMGWNPIPIFGNEKNGIRNFHQQWCRMQRWRVDWEEMAKHCEGQVAWDQRQVDSVWRTDANKSFIRKWEIQPAGHFSRFFIQSVKRDGFLKVFGGDAWRVYIRQGPASLAPQVWDHGNGIYEVVFLVMEPGNYSAQITLDFTLCDGLREPPVDWFIKGTVQGKSQRDGILGYIGDDYILQPLGGQKAVTFSVPENCDTSQCFVVPGHRDFESADPSSIKTATTCGITCNLLQNGFGRWVSGVWLPYVQSNATTALAENPIAQADTLKVYGDSIAQYFVKSLRSQGICKKNFKECKLSYVWIYELTSMEEANSKFEPNDFNKTVILQYITKMFDSSDMRSQNSVFLFNIGVHYTISINFTTYKDLIDSVVKLIKSRVDVGNQNMPIVIWKTSTSIEMEKTYLKTHWRFHTYQRQELFHKYATSAMCKAGIHVLDVYPMTASYPNGTLDHVHYSENAQRAAEDQLLAFVTEEVKKNRRNITNS